MTPFPCGCLSSSLHALLLYTVFKAATVENPAELPAAPLSYTVTTRALGPEPVTVASSSPQSHPHILSFSFYLAVEPTANVRRWTLKHHTGHSETPAVHLCSSLVEKMKGLLLSYFTQGMVFKDLPEQLHLSWWWGWQRTDVGIKEEVYGAFPWLGWKSGPWCQIKLKKKKKGSHLWASKADFNTLHREPKERMEKKALPPVNHIQSQLKPGIECPFPYSIRN